MAHPYDVQAMGRRDHAREITRQPAPVVRVQQEGKQALGREDVMNSTRMIEPNIITSLPAATNMQFTAYASVTSITNCNC